MSDLLDTQLHAIIGEDGFVRLVASFYKKVAADDIIGPMYPPADLPGAELRLRHFLIQRFGGPDLYSQQRGHPRLRMRHSPFIINQAARDRWVMLMEQAIIESKMPPQAIAPLRKFFHEAATFMINQ